MARPWRVALTDVERTLCRALRGGGPGAQWPSPIGKSFTAVIALQLVEEGLLDLDAAVTDYVPWLTPRSRFGPITVHHLLTHSAGVIESSDLAPASNYDVLALPDPQTGFAPGPHRHYSNVGYRAVGWFSETVPGRALRAARAAARADGWEGLHCSEEARHARPLAGGTSPLRLPPWPREQASRAAWVVPKRRACAVAGMTWPLLRALGRARVAVGPRFAAMKGRPLAGGANLRLGLGIQLTASSTTSTMARLRSYSVPIGAGSARWRSRRVAARGSAGEGLRARHRPRTS